MTFCHSGIYNEGELWKQYLNHIRKIFLAIRKSGMKLNKAKCEFGKAVVDYLWFQIGLNFISPRLRNIEAMIKFPCPTTKHQLQQWTGLATHYKLFFDKFSDSIVHLTDCIRVRTNLYGMIKPKKLLLN